MSELKIERHFWMPAFPNEISITDDRGSEEFEVTLKQGEEIEIGFTWDHGYGGRGSSYMYIPIELLKDLLKELEQ